jgi:hypothetical protein
MQNDLCTIFSENKQAPKLIRNLYRALQIERMSIKPALPPLPDDAEDLVRVYDVVIAPLAFRHCLQPKCLWPPAVTSLFAHAGCCAEESNDGL